MTMQSATHPDEERLAAFAGADLEATGDRALREHLDACPSCSAVVDELTQLRVALAELPDVAPSRRLQLPSAEAHPRSRPMSDALAALVRRGFAPALAAGASLALVGMIGTAGTAGVLEGLGGGADGAPAALERDTEPDGFDGGHELAPDDAAQPGTVAGEADGDEEDFSTSRTLATDEFPQRSPWPMVLFTGVALMIAAFLLRWILQPRAG